MNKIAFITSTALLLLLAIAHSEAGDPGTEKDAQAARLAEGQSLFDEETFGGNGRTCVTCHSVKTGTISPQEVQARFLLNSADPLFVHDGLDDDDLDGMPDSPTVNNPSNVERISEHATIRVEIPLPDYVELVDENGMPLLDESGMKIKSVTFNRGVPSTVNTPALDPALMYDGRAPNLQEQALGAIHGHAQNSFEPSQEQLDLIAEFQQKDKRFFSSNKLRKFAAGKKPPKLPEGETPAEKRGRAMFDDVPLDPEMKSTAGVCAVCHSGPMLNEFNEHNPFFAPPGARFGNVLVSERNLMGNPVYNFKVLNQDGSEPTFTTPDPGVLLTDPRPPEFPPFLPFSFTANFFKIPQLWGVAERAPYFHDNSAKTLEDVAEQYQFFFMESLNFDFDEQDQADMVAFLKLLSSNPADD